MLKSRIKIGLVIFIISLFSVVWAYTHSGRTDKYGGHHDRINGGYHYHNSGTVGQIPTQPALQAQPVNKPANSTSPQQLTTQPQAIFDAKLDAGQHVTAMNWFLAGAGCGVIAFAYAVVDTPKVPPTRLLGKSPDYITVYTVEYQSKAKTKRITNSCLGWGTFGILYFAYLGLTSGY